MLAAGSVFSRPPSSQTQYQRPKSHRQLSRSQSLSAKSEQSSSDSLVSTLQSCSSLLDVRKLHAVAIRSSLVSVRFVANNIISSYVSLRDVCSARKLFDGMARRNVVSWTALLNGYSKLGLEDDVLQLLERMVLEEDVHLNGFTYVCLLKFCSERCYFELGRQVHARIIKCGLSSLILDSAVLYFYVQCGDLAKAAATFSGMPVQDVVSWTTMITGYVHNGQADRAIATFCSAVSTNYFQPNEFTVCSVLKACAEGGNLRFGRQMHCAVAKQMYKEDVYIGSALLTMYVRCGEIADARSVFDSMPRRNTITWTSMIAGYAQHVLAEKAIMLFRRMKSRRVSANNFTIASILSACGSTRSLNLGKEVHGLIVKSCLADNIQITSTLIWFYCKCGLLSYAARVHKLMSPKDAILWTTMISGYAGVGHNAKALRSLSDMLLDGAIPNVFTYSSSLKACANLENVQCGKMIHASVNKTSPMNVVLGSSLIGMYMRCGDVVDAQKVFDALAERNLVTWKIMILGLAKNRCCREALQMMYRMQEEGFEIDDFVYGTVLSTCGDFQGESRSNAPHTVASSSIKNSWKDGIQVH